MVLKDKYIKGCLLFLVFLFATFGLVLLVVSHLSFELVKTKIDALAIDGEVNFFSISFFKKIVIKLKLIGIALLIFSGMIYIFRRRALQYISNILISFSSFFSELIQSFKEALRKEDKIHVYTFFIVLLVGIAVRVFFLFRPMAHDEALTFIRFASKPLYIGLTYYPEPNNHFFHTFLVHIVYLLLGKQPWMIRLPALFAGILLIPASYLVARTFYNKYAALLTASLVASSSMFIHYSTAARGHIIVCLVFMLIFALGIYLKQNRNTAAWFLFIILSSIGFYTIPLMLYPFGVVITWLFLSVIFKDTNLSRYHLLMDLFIALIIIALLIFILYAPVFVISGLKTVVANPWTIPKPWSHLGANFLPFLDLLWMKWNNGIPSVIKFFMVIGFFISLIFHKRLSSHRVHIILPVIIWCIPIMIIQRDFFYVRLWMFLLLLYIIFASSGSSYIFKAIETKFSNKKSVVIPILAITLSILLSVNIVRITNPSVYLTEARDTTIFLKNNLEPEDKVIITSTALYDILEYYFMLYGIPGEYFNPNFVFTPRVFVIVDKHYFGETLKEVLNVYKRRHCPPNEDCLSPFSTPRLIQQYTFVSLYEMKRLNSNSDLLK